MGTHPPRRFLFPYSSFEEDTEAFGLFFVSVGKGKAGACHYSFERGTEKEDGRAGGKMEII
jgi:hypothetical protein